jgi:hypothetical protein
MTVQRQDRGQLAARALWFEQICLRRRAIWQLPGKVFNLKSIGDKASLDSDFGRAAGRGHGEALEQPLAGRSSRSLQRELRNE